MLKMRATTGLPYRTKDLRAYAASALVDVGATHEEAQRLLGHSTSDTTSKYYLRAQDLKAHDPARTALRFDPSLTLPSVSMHFGTLGPTDSMIRWWAESLSKMR